MVGRDDRNDVSHGRVRKTVTVLFADLVDSTPLGERLDPEALQAVIEMYGDAMHRVVDRHGGWVDKFIGDAVMAVFGLPVLHEDDALRAVRAAFEMHSTLDALNLELARDYDLTLAMRIGIHTGEVVAAIGATGQTLIAGDTMNTAARLEQTAPAGGVLTSDETRRLVDRAVRSRRLDNLRLKGKSATMRAWHLEGLVPAGPTRGRRRPLVGRGRELRVLTGVMRRVSEQPACRLVTVVGPAGIGKSRLVREFVDRIGPTARVLVGRCVPYGDGITYFPLREVVESLGGPDAVRTALARDPQHELVASVVSAAVGQSAGSASIHDVQWAFRRFLEALAREHPVVLVIDDIHWADDALRELIGHLAEDVEGVPLMIVCLSRESSDVSSAPHRTTLTLRPLSETQSAELLRRVATREVRTQRAEILAAAEGNPLFIEQFLAMRADDPTGRTPPTIQSLLASRVDGLPQAERRVVEAAAVEGREFRRAAVESLIAQDGHVDIPGVLVELERRELIVAADPQLDGGSRFRFAHILVRDAAYELIPKARRAELHVRYADWLVQSGASRSEQDELAGYHLEQAFQNRSEIRLVATHDMRALADRACAHLTAAGRRVLDQGDRAGAVNLLRRSIALRPEDAERASLLISLGGVLREEGEFSQADDVLREACECARIMENEVLEARSETERLLAHLQVDPQAVATRVAADGGRLEQAMALGGDHAGLARLWHTRALLEWIRARSSSAEELWRLGRLEAIAAGDRRFLSDMLGWSAASVYYGPTPVKLALERCEQLCSELRDDPWAEALALQPLAGLHAMAGSFAVAFDLLDRSAKVLAGFEPTVDAAVSHFEVSVSLLAGDPDRAERHLRAGRRLLVRMGERAVLASTEAYLAQVVLVQGNLKLADRLAGRCARVATADDVAAQALWRRVRARVRSAQGNSPQAIRLADEAVALMQGADWINDHAEALADAAAVRAAADDHAEADRLLDAAIQMYERKGNLAAIRRLPTYVAI
jgi:class 3 adenylate cyclase/tetratricopeptide (TPR) repeat protein